MNRSTFHVLCFISLDILPGTDARTALGDNGKYYGRVRHGDDHQ